MRETLINLGWWRVKVKPGQVQVDMAVTLYMLNVRIVDAVLCTTVVLS
jgi:hypothetical protein